MTSSIIVLIATIPPRKRSCERLLSEIAQQSRVPDCVVLCLDGYGDLPAPTCPLPFKEYRTTERAGSGARWRIAATIAPDDILINIDDDYTLLSAPHFIHNLVAAIEHGADAAAAMGRTADGKQAPPGDVSRGTLIYAAGCGFAVRAGHLWSLRAFADEVIAAGGPDALGPLGDDDALVSAYLWKRGIPILHAATGVIQAAPNTRASSQTQARSQKREQPNEQKRRIGKITGWPWPKELH